MSVITVTSINVLNNPAPFLAPLEFEVHYEAILDLEDDVEWKMVYVGSADDKSHDQELESVLVGPVTQGKYKFVFQADPPDPLKIPNEDLVGLTAVLLCCAYRDQEFLRIGYYVQVDFKDEALKDDPPANPSVEQLQRNVLEEDPRLTHYAIDWPKHLQIPEVEPPEVIQELDGQVEGSKSPSEREGDEEQEEEDEVEDVDEEEDEEEDQKCEHPVVVDSGTEAGLDVDLLG